MFNWICPECGRDVPPSATECRFCAERKKAAETAGVAVGTAPPPAAPPAVEPPLSYGAPPPPQQPQAQQPPPQYTQQYAPPPQQYAPPQQPYAPPQQPYYPPQQPVQQPYYQQPRYPPAKAALPTWAMAIIFGLGFIVLIGAILFGYQYFGKGPRAERAGVTEPAAAARAKTSNPLQKYIEVVGIRLVQDAKHHPEARFIVVNHSGAELNDLNANVTLWASTSRSEEDSVGTFSFKLDSIAGNESKELTAPLTTKLKIYELPDWQNATAEVQLTNP